MKTMISSIFSRSERFDRCCQPYKMTSQHIHSISGSLHARFRKLCCYERATGNQCFCTWNAKCLHWGKSFKNQMFLKYLGAIQCWMQARIQYELDCGDLLRKHADDFWCWIAWALTIYSNKRCANSRTLTIFPKYWQLSCLSYLDM